MKRHRTDNGAFQFDRVLFYQVSLGTELATKQSVVLSQLTATDLSIAELRDRFDYEIEGVTPLRAVVAAANHAEPHGAVCVELLPRGSSLVEKSVPAARRGAVARELARIIAGAHERGIALVGLRPDLVFVDERVTIVPRWATFLTLRSKRLKYIEDNFTEPSPADRFIDLTLVRDEDSRVDIYLLGLLITWLWTDRHALDEDDRRLPWPGPPELDALLGSMISRDPAERPRIEDVIAALERI